MVSCSVSGEELRKMWYVQEYHKKLLRKEYFISFYFSICKKWRQLKIGNLSNLMQRLYLEY